MIKIWHLDALTQTITPQYLATEGNVGHDHAKRTQFLAYLRTYLGGELSLYNIQGDEWFAARAGATPLHNHARLRLALGALGGAPTTPIWQQGVFFHITSDASARLFSVEHTHLSYAAVTNLVIWQLGLQEHRAQVLAHIIPD